MKKITMMSIAALALVFSANAQKLKETDIPAAVKTSFTKHYPGITASWEKEDGQYEASFKKDGKTMSANFDVKGIFTESEMDIKVADLPASVLSYVKEHYKGKAIKEGAKITKADGSVYYEAEVDGKDLIFDANGKFLKAEKE